MDSCVDRGLPAGVAAALDGYRSKLLTGEQSACWLPSLKVLAAGAGPKTPMEATRLLSAACRMMVDLAVSGTESVSDLLTPAGVARWSFLAPLLGHGPEMVSSYTTLANRLVAVSSGVGPFGRERDLSLDATRGSLSVEQALWLFDEAFARREVLAAGLVMSVGAGVSARVRSALRVSLAGDEPVVVLANGVVCRFVEPFIGPARRMVGVEVAANRTAGLRKFLAGVGVGDPIRALARTYRVMVLSEDRSFVDLVARYGFSYGVVDSVRDQLAVPGERELRDVLRG
jgi:hypothetical protein